MCNITEQLLVLRIGQKLLHLTFYEDIKEVALVALLENYVPLWMVTESNLLNKLVQIVVCYLELLEGVDIFEKGQDTRHFFRTAQVRLLDHKLNNFA
jgi:hypothetical protein